MVTKNYYASSSLSNSSSGYFVRGKSASLYEYYVALALDKIKIPYEFQVPVMGGKILRGGQVIDFVVYTVPITPLEVNEEYWHRDATLEAKQELLINAIAKRYGWGDLVILWGEDVETEEKALVSVRRLFG